MKVVELGGGENPKYHPNVDVRKLENVDIVADFGKPLPLPSNEYDMVYSSYVIEHVSWRKVKNFIKEIHRILKSKGKAVIITANLLEQCRKVVNTKNWNLDASCLIFGGQDYPDNCHKCGFSPSYAVKLFKEAGFTEVQVKPHPNTETDMILEAHKGEALELAVAVDRVDWIRKHCRKGEKTLDIGCANGWVFRGSNLESDVTFLDIDLYDLPNFVRMDAHKLFKTKKFKAKQFDVAVLAEILEHVKDPVLVLKGAYRVAKILLITVPDPANWIPEYRPYNTLSEEIKRTGKTVEQLARKDNPEAVEFYREDGYKHLFHRRWYTQEMLEKHLEQAGIRDYQLNRLAYGGWSFFVVEAPAPIKKITSKKRSKEMLKIGLISAPFLRVPPDTYGGAEMIIADLAEVLAQKEHEVTIFAADGSKVEGCEIIEFGAPIKKVHVDWLGAEKQAYERIQDKLDGFDIIHDHTWFGWVYKSKALNPALKVCHTHHGGLYQQWWGRSKPPFKLNMVAISKWMKSVYEKQGFTAKYVYNGINMERYVYKNKKGNRLLFVGRFSTFKQPHVAIEIAKKLDMPIDLVGGSFVDDPNYLERIKAMCDGDKVTMYLDAPHETKIKLMQNAKCLLFPSRMGEPFGLVAVETMACGSRVVALNDGAIAEVVEEGGFVCADVDAMVDAVQDIHRVKPKACRKNAERFSRSNMASSYLKLYRSILAGNQW